MFADYVHRRISPTKFVTKLSKITRSLRYKAKPDLVIQRNQDRLDLSPEEHRLHAWTGPAFRGTHKLIHSCCKSNKNPQKKF